MATQTFTEIATLHTGKHVAVRRCRMEGHPGTVVVKQLTEDPITPRHRARVGHEFRVLQSLQAAGATLMPKPLHWLDEHARVALVMEDLGARCLREEMAGQRLPLDVVLHIGQEVCRGLSQMHQARIIHKDLNPNNILYVPQTRTVQIIDFGIAALMASEVQRAESASALEGTLGYLSPEQTGRTSYLVDPRTDFYALGATLFELLAGRLVFEEADPTALVYAILTREAPDLSRVRPDVPPALAAVVAKLLQKAPDQRYQSAHGIESDLRRCAELVAAGRSGETFVLAQADRNERFELSQKVYGRGHAVQVLRTAYDAAVARKRANMALVRGPSGIGKSALVGELRAALVEEGGLLAMGKCDVLSRDQPFAAFSQSIAMVVRYLLTEPEPVLELWRRRLQAAVGKVGATLVALAPSLERVLGPQPDAPTLGPAETESRLLYILQRFMRALCAEQPVVLFLDDLQWADTGTLKLVRQLATDDACAHGLLLVAAYRDNEVDASHPLTAMLQELKKKDLEPLAVALEPMTAADVQALLADSMGQSQEMVAPLGQLVLEKTAGNPFFVRQFLKALHDRALLHFDAAHNAWVCDIGAARAANVTDNVLALLRDNLHRLPTEVQTLLSTAACIGNELSFTQLSSMLALPREALGQQLNVCLEAGMLLALGGDHRYVFSEAVNPRYRFVHDRVQQAAYDLLNDAEKTRLHDVLGRQLAAALPPEGAAQAVHATLNHLNKASALRTAAGERLELAALNMRGARLALQASAYGVARDYVLTATALLPEDVWTAHNAMAMELMLLRIETEFLLGNLTQAEQHCRDAMQHATTTMDRAALLQRRMLCLQAIGQHSTACDVGVEALHVLGIPQKRKNTPLNILGAVMRLKRAMKGRSVADLKKLPRLTDPMEIRRREIFTWLTHSAFFSDPNLSVVTNINSVIHTIAHGLTDESHYTFAGYIIVGIALNDYKSAREWTDLSLSMAAEDDSPLAARAAVVTTIFCDFDVMAPRTLVDDYTAAGQLALESGDANYGGMAGFLAATMLQFISIPETLDSLPRFGDNISVQRTELANNFRYMRQLCLCMQGKTLSPTDFTDDTYKEADFIAALPTLSVGAQMTYYWYKLLALWRHRALDDALAIARDAWKSGLFTLGAEQTSITYGFIYGLLLMERCYSNPGRRLDEPKVFKACLNKLRVGTRDPRSHFPGCYTLLQAEVAARANDHAKAGPLYDKAIDQLQKGGYVAFTAEGWERRGRYFLRTGQHLAAGHALGTAVRLYRSWGATVRVQMLMQEMHAVLTSVGFSAAAPTQTATHTLGTGTVGTQTREEGDLAGMDVQAILRISQALSRERSPLKLIEQALHHLGEITGATRLALLLLDAGKTELRSARDTQAGGGFPDTLLQFVRRSGEAVALEDTAAEHMFSKDAYFQGHTVRALVCVPLQAQGLLRGVLYLENSRAAHSFPPAIVESVRVLAAQTVVALDNAELYAELESRVQQRTVVMRGEHERAIEAQRVGTALQMAGGFAHEVRNALAPSLYTTLALFSDNPSDDATVLRTQAQVIDQVEGVAQRTQDTELQAICAQLRDGTQEMNESLNIVLQAVRRALSLSEVTTAYAEAGQTLPGADSIDLRSQVDRVLGTLRADLDKHGIQVEAHVPDKLVATMAADHFETVLRTLLSNARDAVLESGSQGKTIRIDVQTRSAGKQAQGGEGEEVALAVQDAGAGMDAATQKRVFQPFFSTKGAKGRGLALGISQQLLQAYGGGIVFETRAKEGSTFTASWPNLRK